MKWRLVDHIVSWSPYVRIRGLKAVSFEEYSLKEALGDESRLPESLLLESLFQLGNWLIMLSSDFTLMGIVTRMSSVRFEQSLRPGQRLEMEVRLERQREDGFEFSGHGRADGHVVITGSGCLAVPVPLRDFANPEALRVLFSEISQPMVEAKS